MVRFLVFLSVLFLTACQMIPGLPLPGLSTSTPAATPSIINSTAPKGATATPTLAAVPQPGRYRIQPVSTVPPPFGVQSGSPRFIANFARLDKGCNWMGAAGQVFELNRQPVLNLVVVISGTLAGVQVDAVGLTGSATMYGPGGYEIVIADKVVNSTGTLKIQLFDLAGAALTEPAAINTVADCTKNLLIVNFNRFPGPFRYLFPVIGR